MRRVVLSHPLPVFALVSRYLTNNLIGRSPISQGSKPLPEYDSTSGITMPDFPMLSLAWGYVRNALLALSPLYSHPKVTFAFDLHVLAMPPAFPVVRDRTTRNELLKYLHHAVV